MSPCARPLNVMIIHADPIVRAGLVAALAQQANIAIFVHDADDCPSGESRIDVVVADYDSAMRLAEPAARSAFGRLVDSRILAFTANDREADIRRAIQAGIRGYLVLGGSLAELVDGVRTVATGARFLSASAAQRMADSLAGVTLTMRENDVLRLVATGHSNKEIARQLSIELGTVKSHVSAIMSKLGAISRTQAASIAATRGLVGEAGLPPSKSFALRRPGLEPRPQFA